LSYWYRPAAAEHTGAPIVFVHGIGVGLLPYLVPISQLEESERACYLIEVPAVSLDVTARLPAAKSVATDIEEMLAAHGDYDKDTQGGGAVFVGHSFGSVYLSYVVKYAPRAIVGACFVEPVCFLISLRKTLEQFLYAPCDPVMDLIRSDAGVARALRREFWWSEAALWREQLGVAACRDHVAVFLADNDEIVPSEEVRNLLLAPQPPPLLTNVLEQVLGNIGEHAPRQLAEALAEAKEHAGDSSMAANVAAEVLSFPTFGHGKWEYDRAASRRVVDKALELASRADVRRA
jgi:pimeloyl-ACP methyl ester carboxylesterase